MPTNVDPSPLFDWKPHYVFASNHERWLVQRTGENTNGRGTLSIELMIERFEIRLDGYLIKAKRGCDSNFDWFPPWDAVLSSHQVCLSPVLQTLFPFCMGPPSGDVTNMRCVPEGAARAQQ